MSYTARLWAYEQEDLSVATKSVLNTLADYANEETLLAFPSVASIMRRVGCSRSTVQKALRQLRERELIKTTVKNPSKGLKQHRLLIPLRWLVDFTNRQRNKNRVASAYRTIAAMLARGKAGAEEPEATASEDEKQTFGCVKYGHRTSTNASSPLRSEEEVEGEAPSRAADFRRGVAAATKSLADRVKSKLSKGDKSRVAKRARGLPPEADPRIVRRYTKLRKSLDPSYEPMRGHVVIFGQLTAALRRNRVAERHWPDYVDWIFDAWPRITKDRQNIPPPKVMLYPGNMDSWIAELPPRDLDRMKVHAFVATQFDDEDAARVATTFVLQMARLLIQGKRLPAEFSIVNPDVKPVVVIEFARTVHENIDNFLQD